MPPEIHLRKPPQEGLQLTDGSVRIALDIDVILGGETLELYPDAVAISFKDREDVTSVVTVLAHHVRFDPEEIADRKTGLIESVATSLVNDSSFPQGQELYVRFTRQEITGVYQDGVIFGNQVAVNDTFLVLIPHSAFLEGRSFGSGLQERFGVILDRLHLSDTDDLKQLRMRVVAQGATDYPTNALRLIDEIEGKVNDLARRPELREVSGDTATA